MIWELGILLIFLKLRHELSTIATTLHALVRGSFHQLEFNLLASAIDSKRLAEILPPFHGDMNILVFWRLKRFMMMWRLIIRYPSRPCMVLMAIMKAMDPSWSIAKSRQHEIAASYSITCYPQHSSG